MNIRKRLSEVDWDRAHLNLREAFRSYAEYKEFKKSQEELKAVFPKGDGHPVLIFPSFGSNDKTTQPLRAFLSDMGYKPYAWEGGFNVGIKDKTAHHLYERLIKIYEENGHQKVTLIGHSLGGLYARTLAQEYPNMVKEVITVGTPFGIGMQKDEKRRHTITQKLNDPRYSLNNPGMPERLLTPPAGIPTTSIFSKSDGIGGWQSCLNPATPLSENIEVSSSHLGMIWHKDTLSIILDRMTQSGPWKPYAHPAAETPPKNPNWAPPANDNNWKFYTPAPPPASPKPGTPKP